MMDKDSAPAPGENRENPSGSYRYPPEGGAPTTPVPPPPPPYPQGGYASPPQPPPGPYAQGGYPPAYPQYPYPNPYPQAPVKKGLPRWFWGIMAALGVFMIIAIIAIVSLGSWFGDTLGKPVAAVTRFYTALEAGDCEEARSLLTTSMQRVDYCGRWKALEAQGTTSVGSLSGSINVRNGISTIAWSLLAGGDPHSVDIQLQEAGGQMKIIGSFPDLLPQP